VDRDLFSISIGLGINGKLKKIEVRKGMGCRYMAYLARVCNDDILLGLVS
jgi:hypothetical protein